MPKILSSDIALNDQKQRSLVLICNYPFVWSWLDSRYNSLNLSSGTAYTYMIAIDDMYGHSIAFRIMVKVFIPIARGLFSSYCMVSKFNIKFISQVFPSCLVLHGCVCFHYKIDHKNVDERKISMLCTIMQLLNRPLSTGDILTNQLSLARYLEQLIYYECELKVLFL